MDDLTLILTAGCAILVVYWLRNHLQKFNFWKEKNVATIPSKIFVGNSWPVLSGSMSQFDFYSYVYWTHPSEPMVGVYNFSRPVLVVRDPKLIYNVLVRDFSHFTDRGFSPDEKVSPIDVGLVVMKGSSWKAMRNKLTPAFSSGKIKNMFGLINNSGEDLVKFIKNKKGAEIDLKNLTILLLCDIIGSCVFGIDLKSTENPESEFIQMARKAFILSPIRLFKFFLSVNFPSLGSWLRFAFTAPDVAEYFSKIIKSTIQYRRDNKVQRNDFLQLLLELKEQGFIRVPNTEAKADDNQFEFTDIQLVAQAYTFLSAGFDTSSTTLLYTLYELSLNEHVQSKAREEVQRVLNEEGCTYEALKQMTYLDKCINETLRLHPVARAFFRVCTKDYTFDNGVQITQGQTVILPAEALHKDPKYHLDPDLFKPERFDECPTPEKGTFLPFGDGPRICIGMRFAMVNMKLGLALILSNFRVVLSPKTEPLVIDPKSFVNGPLNSVFCQFLPLEQE